MVLSEERVIATHLYGNVEPFLPQRLPPQERAGRFELAKGQVQAMAASLAVPLRCPGCRPLGGISWPKQSQRTPSPHRSPRNVGATVFSSSPVTSEHLLSP